MKYPWNAIVWWEIRRIPFNLLLLAVGTISGLVSLLIANRLSGPDANLGSPAIGVALYGIAANVCYTLGWITELLWTWGDLDRAARIRHKLFRAGLLFSVLITLSPAVIVSFIWAARNLRI
jgi:hypothetical protein